MFPAQNINHILLSLDQLESSFLVNSNISAQNINQIYYVSKKVYFSRLKSLEIYCFHRYSSTPDRSGKSLPSDEVCFPYRVRYFIIVARVPPSGEVYFP